MARGLVGGGAGGAIIGSPGLIGLIGFSLAVPSLSFAPKGNDSTLTGITRPLISPLTTI